MVPDFATNLQVLRRFQEIFAAQSISLTAYLNITEPRADQWRKSSHWVIQYLVCKHGANRAVQRSIKVILTRGGSLALFEIKLHDDGFYQRVKRHLLRVFGSEALKTGWPDGRVVPYRAQDGKWQK